MKRTANLGLSLLIMLAVAIPSFAQAEAPDVTAYRTIFNETNPAKQAELWREGLAEWGQDGARIRRLGDAADFAVYTPGSTAGLPVSILKSFAAPAPELLDDSEAMRDRVAGTAASLLGLAGIEADPIRSREHILISNILDSAWRAGRDLDLAALIQEIQQPAAQNEVLAVLLDDELRVYTHRLAFSHCFAPTLCRSTA